MYGSSGRISRALTSCASVWYPWLPSVMSGPWSDASARGTTLTRLLKSLKTMLIFTLGYFLVKFAESSFSTGSRPGSWLSYDQIVSVTGPSLSNPDFFTAPSVLTELCSAPGVPPQAPASAAANTTTQSPSHRLVTVGACMPLSSDRRFAPTIPVQALGDGVLWYHRPP